jgi:branched-chain amino acid transport system substrate-binding protein
MSKRLTTRHGTAVLAAAAMLAVACSSTKSTSNTTGTTAAGGCAGSAAPASSNKSPTAVNVAYQASPAPQVATQAGGTLKIGFFGALTGPDAQLGINEHEGEKLALAQHNAKPGVTQVQLVDYDTTGSGTVAPQLAQKAITDKVVAVVGPAFSGESKTADPIFEQAGIVNITASATNPSLADNGWKYFHRAVGNDNAQGPAAANYILKKLNAKCIAVIDDNEEYSLGIANIVRSTITSAGAKVVVTDHIDKTAQDYSATVNKVKAAHPDAIFYGGYYSEGGRFLKQIRDAGITVKFVSDDGANDPKIIDSAGASAADGALLTCPCGDITQSTNPNAASFVSAYTASAHAAPGTYSAEAYDATNVLLQAIDAGKTTAADINTFLSTINYVGLTKTFKFDSKGEVASPTVYMWEVKGGKVVLDGAVDQLIGG